MNVCLHCKVTEIDLAVPESNALFDELTASSPEEENCSILRDPTWVSEALSGFSLIVYARCNQSYGKPLKPGVHHLRSDYRKRTEPGKVWVFCCWLPAKHTHFTDGWQVPMQVRPACMWLTVATTKHTHFTGGWQNL